MRALLDINVLVALFDAEHVHHAAAQDWWAQNRADGWASCPLTQNGYVRVMSQPNYPSPITPTFACDLLAQQISDTDHVFWPDNVALLNTALFDRDRILGPRQVTDIYLLGLAVAHGGRLATFDESIPVRAVRGADQRHIAAIPRV